MSTPRGSVLRDVVQTIIGPGTFQPWAVFWIVLLCMLVRTAALANTFAASGASYRGLLVAFLAQSLAMAIVTAGLFVVVPRVLPTVRRQPQERVGRVGYLLVIVIVSVAATFALMVLHRVVFVPPIPETFIYRPLIRAIPANVGFVLPILLITNGAASKVAERARRTEVVLRSELETVRTERIALIAAEEHVRQEIARTLHDDVQTELLRASMRLSTIGATLPPEERASLDTAVVEIEHAREYGVRAIGRQLAPALSALGLLAALRELCATYAGVVDVEIDADAAFRERFLRTDEEDPVAIAIFRTVEQGVQNALKHAQARSGLLQLMLLPDGRAQLRLTTDGRPLAEGWTPGLGSTVMSAWTDAVGGEWALTAGPEVGAVLVATFGR